jgi:hypothetical protein
MTNLQFPFKESLEIYKGLKKREGWKRISREYEYCREREAKKTTGKRKLFSISDGSENYTGASLGHTPAPSGEGGGGDVRLERKGG